MKRVDDTEMSYEALNELFTLQNNKHPRIIKAIEAFYDTEKKVFLMIQEHADCKYSLSFNVLIDGDLAYL